MRKTKLVWFYDTHQRLRHAAAIENDITALEAEGYELFGQTNESHAAFVKKEVKFEPEQKVEELEERAYAGEDLRGILSGKDDI